MRKRKADVHSFTSHLQIISHMPVNVAHDRLHKNAFKIKNERIYCIIKAH